jgi:hypothetical protein
MTLAPCWRRRAVIVAIVLDLFATSVVLWNAKSIASGMYRFFDHYLAGDALLRATRPR